VDSPILRPRPKIPLIAWCSISAEELVIISENNLKGITLHFYQHGSLESSMKYVWKEKKFRVLFSVWQYV